MVVYIIGAVSVVLAVSGVVWVLYNWDPFPWMDDK